MRSHIFDRSFYSCDTLPAMSKTRAEQTVPTRERILHAGAELFRRQGYAATGLKQIAAESKAPLGSIYHFYPGGKEQLGEEALIVGGRFFLALYEQIAKEAPDLPTAVDRFFSGAAETLLETSFADACPIATVSGEVASTSERLRRASEAAFESWLEALTDDGCAAGLPPQEARALAQQALALLEGAFLLSRSLRSVEPMDACGRAAVKLVSDALDASAPEGAPDVEGRSG